MEKQATSTLTVRQIVTALHKQSQCSAAEAFKQLAIAVTKGDINPTAGGASFIYPDARRFASLLIEAAGCCGFDNGLLQCYSTGGLMLAARLMGGELRPLELLNLEIRVRDLHGATTKHGFPYSHEWSNLTNDDRRKGALAKQTTADRQRLINHVVQRMKAEGRRVTAQLVVTTLVELATWSKADLDRFGVATAKPGAKSGEVRITWKNGGDDYVAASTLHHCITSAKRAAGIRV